MPRFASRVRAARETLFEPLFTSVVGHARPAGYDRYGPGALELAVRGDPAGHLQQCLLGEYNRRMPFTEDEIKEFADIWTAEFGERLTPDQARIEAALLVEFCWLLVQPLSDEEGYAGPPLITL
jgi:hypothetical protein